MLAELDKNPAGQGVYFVRGDATNAEDLERAGIEEAAAALVFPADASNEADMHSILTVMAIESIAPKVRTVAEVNNPRHGTHFRRAQADEILVTSKVASHLLARSALYPGLTELVTDIVSGGEGSELYRVDLPDDVLRPDHRRAVAARLRSEHRATLLVGQPRRARVRQPADRLPAPAGRRRARGRRVARDARAARDPRRELGRAGARGRVDRSGGAGPGLTFVGSRLRPRQGRPSRVRPSRGRPARPRHARPIR